MRKKIIRITILVFCLSVAMFFVYKAIPKKYSLREIGPAGGLIFYDRGSYTTGLTHNWRYLEVAPSDQSTHLQWYNGTYLKTDADAYAYNAQDGKVTLNYNVGTGGANTDKIIAVQGAGNYAAQLCNDLMLGGFSDWFLPSLGELREMYINLHEVLIAQKDTGIVTLVSIGNFSSSDWYWSSSEYREEYAWAHNFSSIRQNVSTNDKSDHSNVRCIRAF